MSQKKSLTESDIKRIFKEEVNKRINKLSEELDVILKLKDSNEKKIVVDPGLKITKVSNDNNIGKKGQLYTVDQIGSWGALLKFVDEDGEHKVKVEREVLEKEFSL